jgi:hypothetical protein
MDAEIKIIFKASTLIITAEESEVARYSEASYQQVVFVLPKHNLLNLLNLLNVLCRL